MPLNPTGCAWERLQQHLNASSLHEAKARACFEKEAGAVGSLADFQARRHLDLIAFQQGFVGEIMQPWASLGGCEELR